MSVHRMTRAEIPLTVPLMEDPITAEAIRPFDLDLAAPIEFYPWMIPDELPFEWGLGLIVGASGSGKSVLLRRFGTIEEIYWDDDYSIASHFPSAETAADRFHAVGLNSVPVWRLPYRVLSNGQRFRADLARRLRDGAVVDEFTSVVDRNVAVAASKALRAWVNRIGASRLVLASCHRDVVDWLRPDWTIDTDAGELHIGQSETRPQWWAEFAKGDRVGRILLD